MTVRVARFFHPRRTAFWATTYSFELELFDQFLLSRLGDPPLNAVVLIDQGKATELWTGLEGEEAWRARRANSDYLVRGVRSEGRGAFHPKTYLFADHEGGTLLVGSGNLTLAGLERGKEAFVAFESSDDDGLYAIRAWQGWVGAIVERLADEQLSRRLTALRLGCPWLIGEEANGHFVTNAGRPLLDQFVERLEAPVAELHICAPFYDHDLAALRELVARTRPGRLHLYFGADTSVAGEALAALVEASASSVALRRFEPERFVHAKLVAAIDGDQGLLLSGSANLSRPALLLDAATRNANVEAGVLATLDADLIRGRLVPPDLELVDLGLDDIRRFDFAPSQEPAPMALTLISATPLPDERVRVNLRGKQPGEGLQLAWDGGSSRIEADATTRDAIDLKAAPVLVWLADENGEHLSNRVPLDDPGALERCLRARAEADDQPRELDPSDAETPIGRILLFLHETCIFDIDETPAATDARRAGEHSPEQENPAFWDRLMRETLGVDHRADSYKRLQERSALLEDDLFSLLSIMLDRAPGERRLRLLVGAEPEDADSEPSEGARWSVEARLRVRVTRVLRRWSRALADPRLRWLSELAPVRNYVALLMATGALWQEGILDKIRAAAVLEDLFGSFVRHERTPGYLATLDDARRAEAVRVLPDEAVELAAALLYCSLSSEAPWSRYIFDWQPFLTSGLEWGLFAPGPKSLDAVTWIVDRHPSIEEMEDRLLWAAQYINDERWAAQTAKDLDLEAVELAHRGYHADYPVRLVVKGVERPLDDPRMLICARQALAYRNADGITVEAGDMRLSLKLGGKAAALTPDRRHLTSEAAVNMIDLRRIEASGAGWGVLVSAAAAGAAT